VRLVISERPGDLLRALDMLAHAPGELLELAEPALQSAEPRVRARAVAVLGRDPGRHVGRLRELTSDPDPRVRFALVEALAGPDGWEADVLRLAADIDPAVARRAWRELVHSRIPSVAEWAAMRLISTRDSYVLKVSHCVFASTELAAAIVAWLEDAPSAYDDPERSYAYGCRNLRIAYTAEHLRPLLSRLIDLYTGGGYSSWDDGMGELERTLVKARDSSADEVVRAELLAGGGAGSILQELLARRDVELLGAWRGFLLGLLRDENGDPDTVSGNRLLAALLLLRLGEGEALGWLLRQAEGPWREDDEPAPLVAITHVAYALEGILDCETEAGMNGFLPWDRTPEATGQVR